ncbi:MAG: PAS domain S-box protein, partial [Aestuariivirgaceae bacterium]|nr:PAS domain S-box protein [Aestuariivirgaceae bacterium]
MNSNNNHHGASLAANTKALLAKAAARLSHLRMAFVVVIIMLAIAMGQTVFQVDKQLTSLRGAPGDNANWNVLQVQTEFFRLQLSRDRAEASGSEEALADLRRRADVFASRVNLLQSASSFDALRGEAWFTKAVAAFADMNRELEQRLAEGRARDPALGSLLDALAPQVQAFASASVQALAASADRQRSSLASLLQLVAALNSVMLMALMAAVVFLANQTRSLRQREQALAESEGRMAATVRAAHDAVIVHDAAGCIMEFNGAAERITGHQRLHAIGQSFAGLLLPPELQDEYARATAAAAETGEGQRLELDVRHAHARVFPADMALGATEGGSGKIFAVHLRDITRHRQEATALRVALEGAEEASQAKARFLAMMSHEIRTPLNGVLGALGLLEDTDLGSEQKLYVTTATRSGEALLNLISDILDLSKMEAGKLELDAVDFPFRQLLDDVRGILAPAAQRHANSFEVNVDPALPEFVTGDLGRLRQVLLNFGSNAVKFTTRGKVGISARIIGGAADRPEIEIAVTDTGIGIPRNRLDDLFQDFSMIDDSYQR